MMDAHSLGTSDYRKTCRRKSTAHHETITAFDGCSPTLHWSPISATFPISIPSSSSFFTTRQVKLVPDDKHILLAEFNTADKYLRSSSHSHFSSLHDLFSSKTDSIITGIGIHLLPFLVNLSFENPSLSHISPPSRTPSSHSSALRSSSLATFHPSTTTSRSETRSPSRIPSSLSFDASSHHLPLALSNLRSVPKCFSPGPTLPAPASLFSFPNSLLSSASQKHSSSFPRGILQEFPVVQFPDFLPPQDSVDRILNGVCLRWAADDEHNHIGNSVPISTHGDFDIPTSGSTSFPSPPSSSPLMFYAKNICPPFQATSL